MFGYVSDRGDRYPEYLRQDYRIHRMFYLVPGFYSGTSSVTATECNPVARSSFEDRITGFTGYLVMFPIGGTGTQNI